jgi:hypothetical protein
MDWEAMIEDPKYAAFQAVAEVMALGSSKDGKDDSWREKPINYHLDRGIRHAITYKLIAEGNQILDGEDHLKLAITRLPFALWKSTSN